jgi:DNA-binding NtrC family response regulator
MFSYPWPGNIRVLENAVFREVVVAEGFSIRAADFGLAGQTTSAQLEAVSSILRELHGQDLH